MWWWRKVHKADIPLVARVLFERYGETVVALLLANALAEHTQLSTDTFRLGGMWEKTVVDIDAAAGWLTERAELAERREDRLETVEWAVLIFVVVGVVADVLLVLHH